MYTYKCKVKKVVDGDTVVVDIDLGFNIIVADQTIRLSGIDTPESRTTNKEEKERGLLSKKKLSEKLSTNAYYTIQTVKEDNNDDKFGRILGVFLNEDGSSVNQWMVDNNYAVSYTGANKELLQEAHGINKQKLVERGEIKG